MHTTPLDSAPVRETPVPNYVLMVFYSYLRRLYPDIRSIQEKFDEDKKFFTCDIVFEGKELSTEEAYKRRKTILAYVTQNVLPQCPPHYVCEHWHIQFQSRHSDQGISYMLDTLCAQSEATGVPIEYSIDEETRNISLSVRGSFSLEDQQEIKQGLLESLSSSLKDGLNSRYVIRFGENGDVATTKRGVWMHVGSLLSKEVS